MCIRVYEAGQPMTLGIREIVGQGNREGERNLKMLLRDRQTKEGAERGMDSTKSRIGAAGLGERLVAVIVYIFFLSFLFLRS